jgi:hypothetical protein
MKNIQKLIELHGELLAENPYCYFEIAYTRPTEWRAWSAPTPARKTRTERCWRLVAE